MFYSIWRQLSLFEFCQIKYFFRDASPIRLYLQCKITDRSEGASPLTVREGAQLNFPKKRAASSFLIGLMMFIKHCRTVDAKISKFLDCVTSRWGIQWLGISFAPICFCFL